MTPDDGGDQRDNEQVELIGTQICQQKKVSRNFVLFRETVKLFSTKIGKTWLETGHVIMSQTGIHQQNHFYCPRTDFTSLIYFLLQKRSNCSWEIDIVSFRNESFLSGWTVLTIYGDNSSNRKNVAPNGWSRRRYHKKNAIRKLRVFYFQLMLSSFHIFLLNMGLAVLILFGSRVFKLNGVQSAWDKALFCVTTISTIGI